MNTSEIKKEIKLLKSFAISILGQDKEGKYHPKFVKETLKSVNEKPVHVFKSKKGLLELLK